MNEENNKLNMSLAQLDLFEQQDIDILNQYSIYNIEQFLGATMGFENLKIIEQLSFDDERLSALKEFIGDNVIDTFKDYNEQYPMGLIKDE